MNNQLARFAPNQFRLIIFPLIFSLSSILLGCQPAANEQPAKPVVSPTPPPAASPTAAPSATPAEPGMTIMPSGLQYKDLEVGAGPRLLFGQHARVRYTGWLKNGIKFDSNDAPHKQPLEFKPGSGEVIKGWDIGVGGGRGIAAMRVGGVRRLIIPPDLGYGSSITGTIPPNSTLIFEVKLIGVR